MVVDAGRRQPGPQTKAVRPCCRLVATAARKPCAIAAPGQSAATVAGGIGLTGPMKAAHRKLNAETAEYRRGQIQTGPNTDGAEYRRGREQTGPKRGRARFPNKVFVSVVKPRRDPRAGWGSGLKPL